MAEKKKTLTEAQQKAAAFLTRAKPDFSGWRDARKAEDRLRAEEQAQEAVARGEVGYQMPDGSIYAGISPDTNKHMYVTAKSASLSMNFNAAAVYAEGLDAHGHQDWRLPSRGELDVLSFNRDNGALKETFNTAGMGHLGYFWSSSITTLIDKEGSAWARQFVDGVIMGGGYDKSYTFSVRCVRS